MNKLLSSLILLIISSSAIAGPAVIWGPQAVKTLKSGIDINGQTSILTGAADPTVTAQNAPAGSLYLMVGGATYRKLDAGSTTNWSKNLASISPSKGLYVDGTRTDTYTADGTQLYPFKTIQAGINQVVTNGDNATYVYNIFVASTTYVENLTLNSLSLKRITFKGAVDYHGNGPTVTSVGTVLDSSSNNGNLVSWSFQNMTFSGNVNIVGATNLTLFGSEQAGFSRCNLTATNVTINNIGFISFYDSLVPLQGGIFLVKNVGFGLISGGDGLTTVGTLQVVTDGAVNKPSGFGNTNLIVERTLVALGTITVDATSYLQGRIGARFGTGAGSISISGTLEAYSSFFRGGLTVNAGGTFTDHGSSRNGTFTNNGTYNPDSKQGYGPVTPGNWSPVPNSTQAGLDTLAAITGAATNLNTASTIVKRDASGNFSASTITAALTGNATTATTAGNVTGTVAIANGGTGQTTKTASFDALSPSTIKGDVTAFNGTNNVRIPVGTDGQALLADSTQTAGVKWGPSYTSPTTTKGDLIARGSSADTRLAIGTDGQVLSADSTAATGMKWAAAASGGMNFVGLNSTWSNATPDDSKFENGLGAWALFHSGTTQPTTMTAGTTTGNLALARTTTAGEFINGTASAKLTKSAASAQGDGASTANVYIPLAYRGKTLTATIPFNILSGSLVQGDVKFFVEDVTNSTIITPFNNDVLGTGPLVATFPVSTNTAQIRIGFYFATTSTTAVTIVFDDVSVAPGQAVYGANISDFALDPNVTLSGFGTISDNFIMSRRVGNAIQVKGSFRTGTVSGATAYLQVGNVTFNPALLTASANASSPGTWEVTSASTSRVFSGDNAGVLFYDGTTNNQLFFAISTGTSSGQNSKVAGSGIVGSNQWISVDVTIPITGWTSNSPISNSSTFNISSFLANGTRVTGVQPANLGEWRSQVRVASGGTFLDTNGSPTALPNGSDGIRIYHGNAYASGDTVSNPTRYDIFVGKNKNVKLVSYASAGRTGNIDISPTQVNGSISMGYNQSYDPTTGIFTITPYYSLTSETGHNSGSWNTVRIDNPYFDLIVSENALAVGIQAPRSGSMDIGVSAYGATDTAILKLGSTSLIGNAISRNAAGGTAANGTVFTINEDGVYSITGTLRASTGGNNYGILRNGSGTQLTLGTGSFAMAANSGYVHIATTVAGQAMPYGWTGPLSNGDTIRLGADTGLAFSTMSLVITKVSN
jgi:hypothetical protein